MREIRQYRVELVRWGETITETVWAASVGEAVEFARGPLAGPTTILGVSAVSEWVVAPLPPAAPSSAYAVEVGGTVVATVQRVELAA